MNHNESIQILEEKTMSDQGIKQQPKKPNPYIYQNNKKTKKKKNLAVKSKLEKSQLDQIPENGSVQ